MNKHIQNPPIFPDHPHIISHTEESNDPQNDLCKRFTAISLQTPQNPIPKFPSRNTKTDFSSKHLSHTIYNCAH